MCETVKMGQKCENAVTESAKDSKTVQSSVKRLQSHSFLSTTSQYYLIFLLSLTNAELEAISINNLTMIQAGL